MLSMILIPQVLTPILLLKIFPMLACTARPHRGSGLVRLIVSFDEDSEMEHAINRDLERVGGREVLEGLVTCQGAFCSSNSVL